MWGTDNDGAVVGTATWTGELVTCSGCTFPEALNYDPSALWDDGSCLLPEVSNFPADINGDGYVTSGDLLDFLGAYGDVCPN